jgi:hypothetical protein
MASPASERWMDASFQGAAAGCSDNRANDQSDAEFLARAHAWTMVSNAWDANLEAEGLLVKLLDGLLKPARNLDRTGPYSSVRRAIRTGAAGLGRPRHRFHGKPSEHSLLARTVTYQGNRPG